MRTNICFLFIAFGLTFICKVNAADGKGPTAAEKFPELLLHKFENKIPNSNVFLAPMALRSTLLATSLVAKENTKSEIENALLYESEPNDVAANLKKLKDGNGWKVQVFVNNNVTDVSKCFKDKVSNFLQYYSSRSNGKEVVKNWLLKKSVSNASADVIVNANDLRNIRNLATLVHVEHLRVDLNFKDIFKGGSIAALINITHPMMHKTLSLQYGILNDLNAEAAILPLQNGLSVLVLQPLNSQLSNALIFENLKKKLINTDIRTIRNGLGRKFVNLYFPVLNGLKMERSLNDVTKELGIREAFDKNKANFDKLHCCADDVYIKNVFQDTKLTAQLKYMELTTVTTVQMLLSDKPKAYLLSGEEVEIDDIDGEGEEEVEERDEGDVVVPTESSDPGFTQPEVVDLVFDRFLLALIRDNEGPIVMATVVKFTNQNLKERTRTL